MYVLVGNNKAKEGYRDANSDDPELVRYRNIPGERTTELYFPEGVGLNEAFVTTIFTLGFHFQDGAIPSWVESDSKGLKALLMENFGLTTEAGKKPKDWGKEL